MEGAHGDAVPTPKPPLSYRLCRRFYRFLTNIWFREINIVDDENLPKEGGLLYITWHPSGLIDPMLMTSVLPGQLTTVAKHPLFRIPVLGRLLRASNVVPIERPSDSKDLEASRQRNTARLQSLSSLLSKGGSLLIFPEGVTHADAGVRTVRSGAARILLAAIREAKENGRPVPNLVPVGLHYSESQRFRERAAVVIERTMDLPEVPENVADDEEQDRLDRAWVQTVTGQIATELERVNHSKISWRERTMIWKGRSLVYAEKQRQAGEELVKPSYAESVLAARRLRAGWE
ncbi:MAG: 1-acyl-sn-glycerol-3-phosphate acyltransferase, partial [Candidatus Poseidonia sp.]|nr:1-acyl-sn-glycerol-3-phosphate acyltransferase [Poseidonia sp.]